LADEVDSSAAETGAANVLVRDASGLIVAYNTDAPALGQLLTNGAPQGQRQAALVLGNGGAALAAVVAAEHAGCERVYVSARRWSGAAQSWESASEFERLGASPRAWGRAVLGAIAPELTLLVQATSAGMRGVGGGQELVDALPWEDFSPSLFAYDVVYNPEVTPFLARAAERGLRCEGGLSMLVGQAALAIELWLSVEPPRAHMMARARAAIFGHEEST